MDPELQKLLDAMKAYADKGKILEAIKGDAALKNDLFQPAFNDGHAVATAAHDGAKTTLKGRLQEAVDAKVAAEAALEKLKKDNPDAAALHTQYGNQIAALTDKIATLESTHLGEKKTAKTKGIRDEVFNALRELKVDRDKANAMADAHQPQYVVGDDLSERILQPGQQIAFSGSDVKSQAKAFAAVLFKDVPKILIGSDIPGGGSDDGHGSTTGESAEGTNSNRADLARIAEQTRNGGKTADGKPKAADVFTSVNERLGRRTLA